MLNKFLGCGRLTKDPEIRDAGEMRVAKYTLAIDRKGKKEETDFLNCVCFGKTAEFAEKYLHKGMKIIIVGRVQTGSYTNKDGIKVYTTDIIVDEHEFVESKNSSENPNGNSGDGGFMTIDDGNSELPF